MAGVHNSVKVQKPPQNSRCPKEDKKEFHWLTDIRRHCTYQGCLIMLPTPPSSERLMVRRQYVMTWRWRKRKRLWTIPAFVQMKWEKKTGQSRANSSPAEIRKGELQNAGQRRYHASQIAWCQELLNTQPEVSNKRKTFGRKHKWQ